MFPVAISFRTVITRLVPALFTVAALALPLLAEDATHPKHPFLWKVEGKDLQKPSWLFGTIHLSAPEMKDLHPAAEKAFTEADAVFTEIPMDLKAQMALIPTLVRTDGKSLAESIGDPLSAELDAELKAINPVLDSVPFQTMKTWVMSMTLPLLKTQLQGNIALDSILWKRATEAGQKTGGLETAASQTGIFEKFTEAENTTMLASTIRQMKDAREGGEDLSDELMKAYISGDEANITGAIEKSERLMELEADPELGKRFMKLLLTDRNVTMTDTIEEKLKAAPAEVQFFAVGTGHLVGKQSIVTLLSEKGYTVTRIQD